MNVAGSIARELGFDADRLRRIDSVLEADVERGVIPGAVALVAREGKIAHFAAYGFRDRERGDPMHTDTLFRAASMTKPVVVAAALTLVEKGMLQLFEPIAKYVPEFENLAVGEAREPASRPPTIQDLMRHTAGFTYGQFGDSAVQRLYRDANVMNPEQTNAALLAKLAELPLAYQPGSTFEYGMSIDVLGALLERVTGETLDRVLAHCLFEPLGMRDTAFILDDARAERLAEPLASSAYDVTVSKGLYDHTRLQRWFSGGGGLVTTANDYLRFAAMLLDGGATRDGRVLSRAFVRAMTSDHLPPGVEFGPFTALLGITAPLPRYGQGFGLGVVVRTHPGRNPNPGSVGDFSWTGISGTYWWADPAEQLAVILLLAAPTLRIHYRAVMRDLVYAALL